VALPHAQFLGGSRRRLALIIGTSDYYHRHNNNDNDNDPTTTATAPASERVASYRCVFEILLFATEAGVCDVT